MEGKEGGREDGRAGRERAQKMKTKRVDPSSEPRGACEHHWLRPQNQELRQLSSERKAESPSSYTHTCSEVQPAGTAHCYIWGTPGSTGAEKKIQLQTDNSEIWTHMRHIFQPPV